ncbi:hypothetical protein AAFF_G00305880 [Aldrovandia affinis]|uniref:Uncharacterized protein n=1 Tax=Aldrovandia affinis TaxID=143900 RepID=A0AAD7SQM7_9TELE|nr:hypothetical protein AAFF_G00305880 [Aldrovandia affinis]
MGPFSGAGLASPRRDSGVRSLALSGAAGRHGDVISVTLAPARTGACVNDAVRFADRSHLSFRGSQWSQFPTELCKGPGVPARDASAKACGSMDNGTRAGRHAACSGAFLGTRMRRISLPSAASRSPSFSDEYAEGRAETGDGSRTFLHSHALVAELRDARPGGTGDSARAGSTRTVDRNGNRSGTGCDERHFNIEIPIWLNDGRQSFSILA